MVMTISHLQNAVSKRRAEQRKRNGRRRHKAAGVPSVQGRGWPILSDALGVAPHQINQERRDLAAMDCPTDFTPDGRAILRSKGHRKKLAELLGVYDRNGGYSDPQRK